jgi:hypothetical protein
MRRTFGVAALLVALMATGAGMAAEPPCCEPPQECWLQRLGPVGGWNPGGGLLHWWDAHCFPCGGAPDDYCRKPMPKVCWPCYPPYFTWGPPEVCHPQSNSSGDCNRPR